MEIYMISDIIIVVLLCSQFLTYYNYNKKKTTTVVERAHLMSIKATITMFLLGLYFNYKFFTDPNYTGLNSFFLKLSIYNLISYFTMDVLVGYTEYHSFMCNLSGYIHHIVYIFVSIIALNTDIAPIYMLYMIDELPTIVLSLGRYNKKFRNDLLFGILFFLIRICYHAYLTYYFRDYKIVLIGGLLSLALHVYWFKNWTKKYAHGRKNKIKQ